MTSGISSSSAAGRNRVRMSTLMLIISLAATPATAGTDVVLDWNEIAARTVIAGQSPFHQARLMAITQLAVFEAVNAVTGKYEPYLAVPIVAPPVTSAKAAAIAAAHRVLKTYFPLNTLIDTDRANALAAIRDGLAKTNGIAVGEAAADAMTALRASDGSSPAAFFLPMSSLLGEWQTTPSCSPAGGAFYQWKDVTPFGMTSPSDFLLPGPPALTSRRYAKDYYEVMTVGPSEHQHGSPGGSSRGSEAVRGLVAELRAQHGDAADRDGAKGLSLTENARALALIMMGINDSLVASFYNKYRYNLWRPETGIRNGAWDHNGKTDGDAGLRDVYPHAVLSELSVRSRQRHRWWSRGHAAPVRRRRSRHHDHEQRAGTGIPPGRDHHQALLAAPARDR